MNPINLPECLTIHNNSTNIEKDQYHTQPKFLIFSKICRQSLSMTINNNKLSEIVYRPEEEWDAEAEEIYLTMNATFDWLFCLMQLYRND